MTKRHCNDGVVFVTDRDTRIKVIDHQRKIQINLKPTDAHRVALNAQDTGFFRKLLDDAVTADIQRKEAHKKNKMELKRIEDAQRRGVPVESAIIQPDKTKAPVRFLRIVPWSRRLWAWVKKPFQSRVAVAAIVPPTKSMMGPKS
jgi:hypothetical protein